MLNLIKRNQVVLATSLVVLFVTLIFIPKFLFLGGDDSKLYYLFPLDFLQNFALKIVSNNVPGSMGAYTSFAYYTFPTFLYWILKSSFEFLGLSSLLFAFIFGLHLAVGFASFFKLLSLFIRDHSFATPIKIIGGLLYAYSVLWIYSIWGHLLLEPLYCFSFFPLLVYLFFKGIQQDSLRPALWIVALLAFFPPLAVPSPWMLGLILASGPILIFLFWGNKVRFLKNSFLILFLTLLCNFYWIAPIVYAPTLEQNDNIMSRATSTEALEVGAMVVKSVASTNQLLFTAMMIPQRSFVENFSSHYISFFKNYFLNFYLLNFVFFLIILWALFLSDPKGLLRIFVISWLLTTFLFTVNIDAWGLDFFILMVKQVPLFGTFKNHFDKFAPAMVLMFSLVFSFSLHTVLRSFDSLKWKRVALALIGLLVLANIAPQIAWTHHQGLNNQPDSFHSKITAINADFVSLNETVKQLPRPGRMLTLPLNLANYFAVADAETNGLYSLSTPPFSITAQMPTISGFMLPQKNGDLLYKSILDKNFPQTLEILKKLSIRYVVVSTETYGKRIKDMLYAGNTLYDIQMSDEFLKQVLGRKIESFGNRYSLYEINPALLESPITIVNGSKVQNLSTSDFDGLCYKAEVPAMILGAAGVLRLSEPPSPGWVATLSDGSEKRILSTVGSGDGLSNRWSLADIQVKQGQMIEACFMPARLTPWFAGVSAIGFAFLLLLILLNHGGHQIDGPSNLRSEKGLPLILISTAFLLFIPSIHFGKALALILLFALGWWRRGLSFALTGLVFVFSVGLQVLGYPQANSVMEFAYYCLPVLIFCEAIRTTTIPTSRP
jgi:hypothetical protein